MSVPRQVLPGSIYLITRRCTQRQFWLKPCQSTTQVVAFCLAWASELTGVRLHAVCVLSNHLHVVVTDPEGQLPEFMRIAHVYIAKCVNASYGRWENLWSCEPPSAVRLEDDADVLDKIAYCLANPVLAGLVHHGRDWPGLRSSPRDVAGTTCVIRRPTVFFRCDGTVPASLRLRYHRPGVYPELGNAQLVERVQDLVRVRETEGRRGQALAGRAPLGVKAVLAQRPSDSPRTLEARRTLAPRVAAKDRLHRIQALRRFRQFVEAYRDAFERFRHGLREVIFPPGTYAMRRLHNVLVADTG
ncbi:MAG: hypothetical protein IT371_04030 [Deltaproteobacteria bacterium]|nr:hypothetical protein [Deltaproteobacteria bacterium]